MTAPQQAAIASQAVHELRKLAHEGHREAVVALRDVALYAIALLDDLELGDAAKQSTRWPVVWDAILEKRKADIERVEALEIGSGLGIRLEGKRVFSYNAQTGFALDVFRELEAIRTNPTRHFHPADEHPELAAPGVLTAEQSKRTWRNLAAALEPLSKDSLPAWADAGREFYRDECQDDWSRFPWPDCVKGKIGSITDVNGNECGGAKAVRDKIEEGLKKLF